ncbi:acyl-CoA dehydrogenase family protein (plasmid) [Rhodococcus pyridinivorans]|uniref:acyl-CoA dehydrogenase family protein n=1 Tax=Rhodococcus TaxID=1827 RepID=UPI0007D92481|nr:MULTISPECIES: acyl-CoA dehydrogenase family protein [Rhodococcus]MCT7293668.1 acyl-CoA dehydrogenase family protein [Rhodococcus sp. PAE-6]QXU56450.1 acyl-CoA dehydrogenase family protein [Rhodococcus sp. LW-XY12]UQB75820.1 acyl-CoA dehydrogenase family protein [Rhodococcus ruber]UVT27509.1 acyl-CoA dehydrogenase family protein [Rhodococcus pyridinivorans]WML66329.1 acyl-CoA dehydrogenase family protein [Rhodococcus sp. AH-ZY2]
MSLDHLTTELDDLTALARDFFTKEVAPRREEFAESGQPDRALYRRAGELGLLCMSVPEEYGGGGATFAHEAVLFREQVRGGEMSMQLGVHTGIVPHYILAYANEEQKRRWLPKLASGEWIGAIAMTEPGTGSDLQAITTQAVRDGDDYVISGAKTFISNGATCDLIIIAVKTDPKQGASGISLLAAEVGDETPGFVRGRKLKKIGQKGQDTTELFFDGLRVPAANLLGTAEGQGFIQLMQQLPQERLIVGVAALGAVESAYEHTLAYVRERHAFGKPLFALQNTRFELAEITTTLEVMRTFVDDAIERHLRGELDVKRAAMIKLWCSDRQTEVIDRCLQLHGGYGYMEEFPIARLFVDGRIARIYAGANEVMKDLIARFL